MQSFGGELNHKPVGGLRSVLLPATQDQTNGQHGPYTSCHYGGHVWYLCAKGMTFIDDIHGKKSPFSASDQAYQICIIH